MNNRPKPVSVFTREQNIAMRQGIVLCSIILGIVAILSSYRNESPVEEVVISSTVLEQPKASIHTFRLEGKELLCVTTESGEFESCNWEAFSQGQ